MGKMDCKTGLNSEGKNVCNSNHVPASKRESADETSKEACSCNSDVNSSKCALTDKENIPIAVRRANPIDFLCIPCKRSRKRKEKEIWFNTFPATNKTKADSESKLPSSPQISVVEPAASNAETEVLVPLSLSLTCKRQARGEAGANEISLTSQNTPPDGNSTPTDTVWSVTNKVLLSRLECPVCFQFMTPPLRQCRSGHSICYTCHDRLNRCPTCRRSFIETSNVILNELCLIVVVPCRYYLAGCQKLLRLSEKVKHEEKCEWMQYDCPEKSKECLWKGKQCDVVEHVLEKHGDAVSRIQLGRYSVLRYTYGVARPAEEAGSDTDSCNIISRLLLLVDADGQEQGVFVFSVRYDLRNGSLCGVLRYVGSEQEAASYSYKIKLASPDDTFCVSARTLAVPYNEDLDDVVASAAVMRLDGCTFKKFVNDQGKFFLFVRVTLCNLDAGQADC